MSEIQDNEKHGHALKIAKAIGYGGLVSGVLDALDGIVAFGILGKNPIQVLQYIASGALGKQAFEGGLITAAAGAGFHFVISFAAAAAYVFGSKRLGFLTKQWIPCGLAYGVWVWAFMNFGVLPLSAVVGPPLTLPLILNGVIGHALFVGLPISYFAKRFA